MFWFSRKKADVLNHWIAFVDGFNMPSDDFYKQVEGALRANEIPEMEGRRIEFLEGSLLSDHRSHDEQLRGRLTRNID